MKLFQKKYDPSKFDSLISQELTVTGDLDFSGALLVDGKVIGKVRSDDVNESAITVGKQGEIKASTINAHFIVIEGSITSDEIHGDDVTFKSSAVIKSSKIFYKKLRIEDGAIIEGELIFMSKNESSNE